MRKALKVALRVGLSLGLVATVLAFTDAAGAWQRLSTAAPGWLLAAAAVLIAQTVLMALRWRMTAGRLGLRIGWRHAVGEYYLSQIVNATLPGGVLGDAARAMRSRHPVGLARATHAVILERMAGQIALFSLMALGFALALIRPGGIGWPGWTMAALAAALAGAVCLVAALRLLGRRSAHIGALWRAARAALLDVEVLPKQIALSLCIAASNLIAFAFCARATGTTLDAELVLTIVPLILVAMLIPLSVAGWGWREGAAAGLFPLAGAAPAAGVAAGLAFGAVLLATSLPGLLWPALAPALPQGPPGQPGPQRRLDILPPRDTGR